MLSALLISYKYKCLLEFCLLSNRHVQPFLGERTQLFLQDATHMDVGDVSTVPTFTCPFLVA